MARDPGRIATARVLGSGLLLGAATAVKAPFVLFGAGLAWAARRSPRDLTAAGAGGAAVLAAAYLAAGRGAVAAVIKRGHGAAGDNLWQVIYRLLGFSSHRLTHITLFAALALVVLAVLLIRRPPPGAQDMPLIWPALAAILAWTFTSPLQRPWYDVMLYVLLVFLLPSRLDWVVLGRSVAGSIAYIPGVVLRLHPAWLRADFNMLVIYVAPGARLLALAALIVLCLTGAWNRRSPTGEPVVASTPATATSVPTGATQPTTTAESSVTTEPVQ